MKTFLKLFVGICVSVRFSMLGAQTGESSGDDPKLLQDSNPLVHLADSLLPGNPIGYFQSIRSTVSQLDICSRTNKEIGATIPSILAGALTNQCPSDPLIALECFKLKRALAVTLATNDTHRPSKFVVSSLAGYLGEIRTAIVSNYAAKQVVLNVMPPQASTNTNGPYVLYFAGMAPKAIHDPVARQAYEDAIRDNQRRNAENQLQQLELPQMEREMAPTVISVLRKYVAKNDSKRDEVSGLCDLARLSVLERQRVGAP